MSESTRSTASTVSPSGGWRSPLLDRPGAVAADHPDAGVAAHYGEPMREQRRLLDGSGYVDASHRDVITVSGPDRLDWLHSLTSQHLSALPAGRPTELLLLSPQGRIEHAAAAVDDGETFWMHTEPGAGAALAAFLDSMRFMMRVEVSEMTADWAVRLRPTEGDPSRWELLSRRTVADWPAELGRPSGIWAAEAFRIAAGRPRLGRDTDDRTIPNEVGLLDRAVHLDKGCYRGQETVARVHTVGRPPRRLVVLHLDGSVDHLPPPGSDVADGERTVGWVGSSARHHDLGPIALALVKRSTALSATLTADGVPASQEPVVDPEAGLHVRPGVRPRR